MQKPAMKSAAARRLANCPSRKQTSSLLSPLAAAGVIFVDENGGEALVLFRKDLTPQTTDN